MYIYVCVNIKFKSTYFTSLNISLSTVTQCISSKNMFYNSFFFFLTLFNYVFFLSNKILIPSKKLKKKSNTTNIDLCFIWYILGVLAAIVSYWLLLEKGRCWNINKKYYINILIVYIKQIYQWEVAKLIHELGHFLGVIHIM